MTHDRGEWMECRADWREFKKGKMYWVSKGLLFYTAHLDFTTYPYNTRRSRHLMPYHLCVFRRAPGE